MKIKITVILLLSSILAAPLAAQDQNRFLQMSVNQLAETWLLRNCGTQEQRQLDLAVLARAERLKPLFEIALEQGPSQDLVKLTSAGARQRFNANQAALQDGESLGLSPENLERAKSRSLEDYIARSVNSLNVGYRDQARLGLQLISSDPGG